MPPRLRSLICAAPFLLPLPAAAEDPGAIQQVIEQQLAAFRSADDVTAFSYASPTIRTLFGTPRRFGDMVEQGYAPIYNSRSARFLGLRQEQGRLFQDVLVTGSNGRTVRARYEMQRQPDGSWKINSVFILPALDT